MDIVERLMDAERLMDDAMDEIERLREALAQIRDYGRPRQRGRLLS